MPSTSHLSDFCRDPAWPGFSARDAGFIDNVLGTTVDAGDWLPRFGWPGRWPASQQRQCRLATISMRLNWLGRARVDSLAGERQLDRHRDSANYQDLESDGFQRLRPARLGDLQTIKFVQQGHPH